MDRFRGDEGAKRSLDKANKLFSKGREAEARGDVKEASRRFKEASDIYASIGERSAFVDSEFLRGHCIAFQALSERAVDKFRGLIEEAIGVINEVRKNYIKDYTSRGVERDVWISYCVNFINALRILLEEDVPAKRETCMRLIGEGETCVEWLERLEESEKAGFLLFWIGFACVRSAPWFEKGEMVDVLRKAAESFSKAKKFFEAARRPRPYLCLEMMQEMCDVKLALEEQSSVQLKTLTVEPKEERCRKIHGYNLALMELYSAVKERFFAEKQRRTYSALGSARETAKWLEGVGDCGLAADAYFLLAKACYEAFKMTLSNKRKRELLEECYEALKKAYMYARAQMKVDVAVKALITMTRVIGEYVKLVDSNALKIKLVREGASYSREALDEVRKLPEDVMFIGEFYGSVANYLTAAAEVEVNEGGRRDLLEKAIEYGEVSLEYEEESKRKGDYMYCLAEAYYMLGKSGQAGAFEKAVEIVKKAREGFISAEDLVGTVRSFMLSGDIQREIWRQKRGGEGYLRARQEYLEAARIAAGMDWKEMEGEALVKLAELEDEKGNYVQASEYYVQALEKFNRVAEGGGEDAKERMKIIEARISIEKGKELLKSRLSEAAYYFRRGSELLLRENKYDAVFYQSLSEFLEAEEMSVDKPREALELLKTASERLKMLREIGDNKRAVALLSLCRGKEHLEEGLALYAEGSYSPALVKFSMAAKALGEAAELGEWDWERAEGYVFFAQGLERFIRGQLGARDEYLEAAGLFRESAKKFVTSKMRNTALGFTDLCYGWHKFSEYFEEEKERGDSYIETRTHFERSLNFFVEAGLSNYAKYVEGLEHFLDGERYVKKLEEADERYYSLAEESYNKAREIFSDAGYVGLEREVEERIQELREREAKRRYLESVIGDDKETKESLRDGFVAVKFNEPADMSLFRVGDKITVNMDFVNIGDAPATLERLENAVPQEFKLVGKTAETVKGGDIVLGRKLAPWEKISLEIKIVAEKKQEVKYQPVVIFRDNKNRKRYFKPKPILILVSEG